MAETKSSFEILNSINVNDHKEAKNGFDYLSWPWAWAETKKVDPKANYRVICDENGAPYFPTKCGAFVKVGVTVNDLEHVEVFPVLNHANKPIPIDQVTCFNINTSIKRCLVKAIAMHGLGLYIYAGEDLPEGEEEPKQQRPAPSSPQANRGQPYRRST